MVPPGLGKLKAIDTRGNESNTVDMGLRQDGTVVIWWKPKDGWLFQVSRGLKQSIVIASGWYDYLALGEDGSVTAWGDNSSGQCDVPARVAVNPASFISAESRQRYREAMIWQRRFWEHGIRDDEDWRMHMDCIHYNPVKHGYFDSPGQWPYGWFRRCVECGMYEPNGGANGAVLIGDH